ncbi:hypothetical protein AFL94_14550 [Arthrobacter sp. LS16]|nr:hypothetical protein AFL94_14550 [Arthrobacter sp. LS16]
MTPELRREFAAARVSAQIDGRLDLDGALHHGIQQFNRRQFLDAEGLGGHGCGQMVQSHSRGKAENQVLSA